MKSLTAALLAILLLLAAAVVFAVNTQFQTRVITSATLTINVKDGVYLTIRNFTQDQLGTSGQRGAVVAGIFATPAPTATPTLSTTAGPGVALSTGGVLTDSATLFGDNNPNGQITFTLLDPTVSPVYTDVVTVSSGNGTYTTAQGNHPGGFSPTTAGTYTWTALYSNDTNGNPAATAAPESVIVTATPTPPPTPTPTPPPILAAILTASITKLSPAEFIKPIIVAGPATLTIDPVPGATLSITYRKMLQPSGTPTPTPASTSTSTPAPTATPTPTVAALSVGSSTTSSQPVTTIESTVSDDEDTFSATPTPTATPVQTSTPATTPLITPTPSPTPTPSH